MVSDGPNLREAFAAAQDWWREAGVDWSYSNEPRDWLAPAKDLAATAKPPSAKRGRAATAAEAPAAVGGDRETWPQSLTSFTEWWLAEPTLDPSASPHRVAPRGPEGAALMVVVAQPERDDRERLLSGPQGRLLAAILGALRIAEDAAYVASLVPAHVGPIDWSALKHGQMGLVLMHHVALARPQRLLVFGREIASSLKDNALAQDSPASGRFRHASGEVPFACVAPLEGLLERPARKASVWRTLLEWTAS